LQLFSNTKIEFGNALPLFEFYLPMFIKI